MYYSILGILSQPKYTTTKVLLFVTLKSSTFCYFGSGANVLLSTHMTVDKYHAIYQNEVFAKSQCIWHENTLLDFFRSNLIALGYNTVDPSNKVWQRGNQTVVVCLVDDFSTCSTNYSTPLPYLFDKNTVVITDNRVNIPTQYQVCQLPSSFFGIYAHMPELTNWAPNRRFNFSVNRIDTKRLLLFLELQLRAIDQPNSHILDYVNFNCWSWDGDNNSDIGLQSNFEQQYQQLEPQFHEVYDSTYQHLLSKMPFRNHQLEHEQAHLKAYLNVVMETYSSDTTIALSEKTFRALCLPVPWMLYCGRHTVAYLNSLGFDVLHDVVEHKYDSMIENKTAAYGDKMVDFLFEGVDTVYKMQNQLPKNRANQASKTNQQRLATMKKAWPADFAKWWPQVVEQIK